MTRNGDVNRQAQRDLAAVSFRLEHDKHERLKAVVERERRSVSQTLAWLVDRYLAEQELTA